MDKFIEFFSGFHIQTILSLIVISWYFTRENKIEIKKEIDEVKKEIDEVKISIKEQSKRTDRLYEMFIDLLNRGK